MMPRPIGSINKRDEATSAPAPELLVVDESLDDVPEVPEDPLTP